MKITNEQKTAQLIGLRLRSKRLHARKGVSEAQNETGIPRSTLQNYEAGIRQAPLTAIKKLARAYHTSAAYLAGLTDDDSNVGGESFSTAEPTLVGKLSSDDDPLAFNSRLLESKGLSPSKLALIKCLDDLLEEVPKGADVLIDTTVTTVIDSDIYAFKDEAGNIKICAARKPIGQPGFTIYATSDVNFPPIHISSDDDNIKVFGRVVYVGSWR